MDAATRAGDRELDRVDETGEPSRLVSEPRAARRKPKKSGRRKKALAPLRHRSQLNLDAPADRPLTEDEVADALEHLGFLKRFKKSLRLSLNATEDLLVNGARAPDDRGVLKHLFAKVDRQIISAALAREPLQSDRGLRTAFLAGVVRLQPTFDNLLSYLDTVAEGDRRAAAEAFGLTVRRLPFDDASDAQLDQLLALAAQKFEGHDYTQAMLGLLDRAHEPIERRRDQLDPDRWSTIAPLAAAHAAVVRGAALPESEEGRALVADGVAAWLAAPSQVLKSYPEKLRWRLAEYAVRAAREVRPDTIPPALFASLPVDDRRYGPLAQLRAEALARAGQVDAARLLVRPVADRPNAPASLKTLVRVLGWPRCGHATFDPTPGPGRLRRAFDLRLGAHGWGRTVPADGAGALVAEAKRQSGLLVPGVAVVLGHGLANDGSAYVVVAGRGRPWTLNPSAPIAEVLQLIFDAAMIARAVDGIGLTLPDFDPARFLIHGRPARLTLADLSGVVAADPTQAALTHGPKLLGLARTVAKDANGQLRTDLPPAVTARLVANTPLPLLVRTLVTALGRTDTPRAPTADTAPKAQTPADDKNGRRRRRKGPPEKPPTPTPASGTGDANPGRAKNRRSKKRPSEGSGATGSPPKTPASSG